MIVSQVPPQNQHLWSVTAYFLHLLVISKDCVQQWILQADPVLHRTFNIIHHFLRSCFPCFHNGVRVIFFSFSSALFWSISVRSHLTLILSRVTYSSTAILSPYSLGTFLSTIFITSFAFSISCVPYSKCDTFDDQARQLDIKPCDMICLHHSLRMS